MLKWAIIPVFAVLALVAQTGVADACRSASRWGGSCPPWAVCSVYCGDCQSSGMLAVCSGTCKAGCAMRFVPRVAVHVPAGDGDVGFVAGLEWVPPVLRGHLSFRGDWWSEAGVRIGPRLTWRPLRALSLATGIDTTYADENLGVGANVFVEYFPSHLARGFIPLQYVSLWSEITSVWSNSSRSTHMLFGIGVWI